MPYADNPGQTHYQGCWRDRRHHACAAERVLELQRVAKAVLLFHSGGPWDEVAKGQWFRLTGKHEATTRSLCDTVRAFLPSEEP